MKLSRCIALLLAATAVTAAADTECPGTESGRAKIDWLYPMPKPASLPPLAAVEKEGAYVLLDEKVLVGWESIYTLMAMVGDKRSFDAFGNIEVQTGFEQFADIKARVQLPDGKITELGAKDIQCTSVDFNIPGLNLGKSLVPRRYVFHFPVLVPGAVLQYQVNIRTHNRDKPDWGYLYNDMLNIRLGSQEGLGLFYSDFVDERTRYAANQVSYIFNIPTGLQYTARSYPEGAVEISEIPSKDSTYSRLLRVRARRPSLPFEPYAPPVGTDTPEVAFMVTTTSTGPASDYYVASKDWKEWVNRALSDAMANTKPDTNAYESVMRESAYSSDTPRRKLAGLLTRFMRDKVANSEGFEVRTGFGHRPPINVVSQAKTAWPLDKALTLVSLLKTSGVDARLVEARAADRKPIDRSLPMAEWFNRFLVAANIDGVTLYFDPVHKVAAGSLPDYLQGGEAMVVKDRSTWEWATLPVSTEADNLARAEITVDGLEGSILKGSLELKFTGVQADDFRENRELSPASLTNYFTAFLDGHARQGVTFSNVTYANFSDPDLPLVIRAGFDYANAGRKLGPKTLLRLLPLRLGPYPSTFAADQRIQAFDFRVPRRFEIVVRLPAGMAGAAALPEPVALSGPASDFERKFAREETRIVLSRRLSLHGRHPAALYPDLKKFLRQVEDADNVELLLEK